ncbi:hypothetical protein RCL1_003632 [Eukaryota sp. TZLM3-RCL]
MALGVFERFLTLWVALAMVVGVAVGRFLPALPTFLKETLTISEVNIPIGILLITIIYPMLTKIDFSAAKNVFLHKRAIAITLITNWCIAPFAMFGWSKLFFQYIFNRWMENEADSYLAGAILLGVAPCTALVFCWSALTKGNAAYTLVQVAINDIILIFAFVPLATFLLNVSSLEVQWTTILYSVLLFVVVPFIMAACTRYFVLKKENGEKLLEKFSEKMGSFTIVALLSTLVLIFTYQADALIDNSFHVLLITIPYFIHTVTIFCLPFFVSVFMKVPMSVAGPSSMIAASNFFELAVAVAIVQYGPDSPAVLATVVGVLSEVPIMLGLCKFVNWWNEKYHKEEQDSTEMKEGQVIP